MRETLDDVLSFLKAPPDLMLPITLDDSEVRSTALRALCRDWVLEWLGWLDPPPLCSSVGLVILSYTKKTCR